jgi:YggT family protein
MNEALRGYELFVLAIRYLVFALAAVVAIVALVDWLVRTRRINPFSAVARFFRRVVDPLMAPVERRIVRSGGQPSSAPWWTLVVVVVGGLALITLLNFLARFFVDLGFGLSSPGRFGVMLLSWAFSILRIALIVRVVSTWFQISPYSRWIRWSHVLTEWMLAPLRRIIPMFGPLDVTPIVAFLLLSLIQGALGIR